MKYRKEKWNLLIASVLIFIISILQWNRWGVKVLQELDDGCFFFLGGPSLWYPTALFPSLVAIGFLITFFCSLGTVEITKTEKMLQLNEKNGLIKQKVAIDTSSVESISISNKKFRASSIGVIVLILSSYYLYIDGISLLTYNAVYGIGIDTGIYYILQASVNILATVLVLFFSPGEIRICSSQVNRVIVNLPIIWRPKQRKSVLAELKRSLDISIDTPTSLKRSENIVVLIYGIVLVILSILSRIFLVFSNEVIRIIYVFIGLMCITYSVKNSGENFERGIWFSTLTKRFQRNGIRMWILGITGLIVISTCFTIINNLIYVRIAPNLVLLITGICISVFLIIIPAIWFDIHMLKTRTRDLT